MKRTTENVNARKTVQQSSQQESGVAEPDQAVDFDDIDDIDDIDEGELVFRNEGGSIFGDTSLIDDALLREAIGGRFRF